MCFQRVALYLCVDATSSHTNVEDIDQSSQINVEDILCPNAKETNEPCPPESWGEPVIFPSKKVCPSCGAKYQPAGTNPESPRPTSAPMDLPPVEAYTLWQYATTGQGLVGNPESPINKAIAKLAIEVVNNEHPEFRGFRLTRTLDEMFEVEKKKIEKKEREIDKSKRRMEEIEETKQDIEDYLKNLEGGEDQGERREQGGGED